MGELEDLRAELAAQQEQQELLKLKEELAKIKRENAALEAEGGGAASARATPAAAPPKKKKSKKAKKAPSAEEAAELAALQKELAAVPGETSRLESGDAKPAAAKPAAAKPAAAGPKSDDAYVRRAYVGGLPYSSTEASVSSYFADACGEVRRVDLKDFDDTPGKFCGIAFVTFGDEDALQRALNLDGSAYEDDERCRLKVRRDQTANRRPPPERKAGSLTVYAGNMGWDTSRDDVAAYFADRGCAVANLRYHTDADTGNFRGFCHVEFEDEASLDAALACAGTKWRGRDLRISHSETAKKRPAEGGKGGKGGRGRGGGAKKQRGGRG